MRILIVEDEFTSRRLLQHFLSPYGDCDIAVNGEEALAAFRQAHEDGQPYDLITLDIRIPKIDGLTTLKEIRSMEKEKGILGLDGIKAIMITVLSNKTNVLGAFNIGCEAYLVKPIDKQKLIEQMKTLNLIK